MPLEVMNSEGSLLLSALLFYFLYIVKKIKTSILSITTKVFSITRMRNVLNNDRKTIQV